MIDSSFGDRTFNQEDPYMLHDFELAWFIRFHSIETKLQFMEGCRYAVDEVICTVRGKLPIPALNEFDRT